MFDEPITADIKTLYEQSSMTAKDQLRFAHMAIDDRFGEGHAAKNPQLVAAFMQYASADFGIGITNKIIGNALQGIAVSLSEIAEAINRQSR